MSEKQEIKIDGKINLDEVSAYWKFYQKHKVKIWAAIWAVVGFFGGSTTDVKIPTLPEYASKASVEQLQAQVSEQDKEIDALTDAITEIAKHVNK